MGEGARDAGIGAGTLTIDAPAGFEFDTTVLGTLAATPGGARAWAWGSNVYGELGRGYSGSPGSEPEAVAGLRDVTAVAAGDYHSLVLKADGTVWGGGLNGSCQLGTGTQTHDRPIPVQAQGISSATAIGTGDLSSFAVTADGRTWAFGYNEHGQLGIGTASEAQPSPAEVPLTGVTSIAGGDYHTLFLVADGAVWASGSNYFGALGVGYDVSGSTPTAVRSHIQNVTDVAAQELQCGCNRLPA